MVGRLTGGHEGLNEGKLIGVGGELVNGIQEFSGVSGRRGEENWFGKEGEGLWGFQVFWVIEEMAEEN
ncbi:hypothetical protein, partial [Paenibacillus xylanexedens]|uniref:hypothetical protein n=1 Tax=Paenibacillus xylanexedens TaxID=528191 RepID=UPI001C93026C